MERWNGYNFVSLDYFISVMLLSCLFQMHMDHIWDILVGIYPSFPLEQYPIIVSVFYYALNIITGITLRRVVKSHISARWQPYLLNTITAFQVTYHSLCINYMIVSSKLIIF